MARRPINGAAPTRDVVDALALDLGELVAAFNRDRSYELANETQALLVHVDRWRRALGGNWLEFEWRALKRLPVYETDEV